MSSLQFILPDYLLHGFVGQAMNIVCIFISIKMCLLWELSNQHFPVFYIQSITSSSCKSGLGKQNAWLQILAVSLTSSVALGMWPCFSVLLFSYLLGGKWECTTQRLFLRISWALTYKVLKTALKTEPSRGDLFTSPNYPFLFNPTAIILDHSYFIYCPDYSPYL